MRNRQNEIQQNDLLGGYQKYNPGFDRMQSPKPPDPVSSALGWTQAGLSGAGLISSLYGNYKANEIAEDNAEMQRREFERQRRMQEEDRKRQEEQQQLANMYSAANRADEGDDRLLNRYQGYFKQIGL